MALFIISSEVEQKHKENWLLLLHTLPCSLSPSSCFSTTLCRPPPGAASGWWTAGASTPAGRSP